MNVKLASIFARRSVRKFTSEPVDDLTVKDLLEAAMAGPSAMAVDPWAFVVVRERERLAEMAEILPYGKMLGHAPLAIVVCGDRNRTHRGLESYMIQDCSAAVQNLLLAASMLGLGACWLGTHPNVERMEALGRLLALPEHLVAFATLAIGHAAEFPPPRTRYDATRVYYEQYK
ncbi:MAG: nitroreductase family protein [Lentisphaerae bacterium]|jgi:nitroreductase|nr:nitroreductase family protein [Lentisphaerota bacterium]